MISVVFDDVVVNVRAFLSPLRASFDVYDRHDILLPMFVAVALRRGGSGS
jgi:hypothetical protein